jgi:hypothetical protein
MKKLLIALMLAFSIGAMPVLAGEKKDGSSEKKECAACKEKGSTCEKCAKKKEESKEKH